MNDSQLFDRPVPSTTYKDVFARLRRAGDCAPYLSRGLVVAACGVVILSGGCSRRSAPPEAAPSQALTYTNPVYRGSMPDPSVIRYQGFYYAFGTTGNGRTPDGRVFTEL